MRLIFILLLTGLSCILGFEERITYDGYKMYKVKPTTDEQMDYLLNIQHDYHLEKRHKENMDFIVKPEKQNQFEKYLKDLKIDFEVSIENIGELIANEAIGDFKKSGNMTWTSYYQLDDIYDWIDSLETNFPGKVTVISAGKTYENRDIKGVKISFGPGKRNVFIEGGIHAREWISPATVTYIINEVLTSTDPTFRKIAESFDWYIFPSTNPDGYVHSHLHNRLWRKTRTSYGLCSGADANRNWDFFWGEHSTSTSTCSDTYGGPKAFSEKETNGLSEFIKSVASEMDVYLAFHSYSQYLLIPYATSTEHLENYNDLYAIGQKAIESLSSRYGTKYKIGTAAEILYEASGTSADWAKFSFKIPIVYTYELRDTGLYGFLLPASKIIPNCLEIMDSVVTIFEEAEKLGYFVLG